MKRRFQTLLCAAVLTGAAGLLTGAAASASPTPGDGAPDRNRTAVPAAPVGAPVGAVPEGTSEEKIMEVLTAYRAYYQDHCQIKTRVYDGLLNMLSELKAKGIKLAVVSNKPDSAVQKLSREYFGDRMDFAVGPSDGVRCKPYPDMAETALKALGIAKKNAVFVGDSEVDVQTGLNAGLDVIAVSWGFRSREVVIEAGAKMIADDASELEKLILE